MTVSFSTVHGGASDDRWVIHFDSGDYSDWGTEEEAESLHALYQSGGVPYTVTHYDYMPYEEDDLDWYRHPSLTPEERNPSLV
jgi:hypothetical protein